jgi:GNAT superfamily N-acetyltransferase
MGDDHVLGDGLAIRRATPADFDAVLGVVQDAARWVQIEKGVPQWRLYLTEEGVADVRCYLAGAAGEEVHVACRGGRPVGALAIMWADPDMWGNVGADGRAGYVHLLSVHRAARGTRLGERTLRWAQRHIASTGRPLIRLDCWAGSAFLPGYYTQLGYTCVACRGGRNGSALFEKPVN